jgi:general secretion pathway protein G
MKNNLRVVLLNNQRGMTLIEILAVLTLLGLIATFLFRQIGGKLDEGKVEATKIQMQTVRGSLEDFKRHCNRYPTSEEGLNALVQKPAGQPECKRYRPGGYTDDGKIPVDAWEQPFTYKSPDNGRSYEIISYGADMTEGGEGYGTDISSKDL